MLASHSSPRQNPLPKGHRQTPHTHTHTHTRGYTRGYTHTDTHALELDTLAELRILLKMKSRPEENATVCLATVCLATEHAPGDALSDLKQT